MFGAFHSTGWVQIVRTVLIAAVLVCGFSVLPSPVIANEVPRTWPAFPKTQTGESSSGFTEEQFRAVFCNTAGNEPNCTNQGIESGSNPVVVITSTCTFAITNRNALENCAVTFSDNRYRLWFERSLSDIGTDGRDDVVAEVQVPPDWRELPGKQVVASIARDVGAGDADVSDSGNEGPNEGIQAAENDDCSLIGGNLKNCLMGIVAKLGASVLWLFVQVFMVLLGFVGVLFNWIVVVTVFQYATYFGNSEGLLMAWSVLRDLGNIFLLFGFIFIGLQTILNIGHFSVGKALPRLLIFAILINFSLFVSSAIVDVSNVFSAGFYSGISGGVNCAAPAEGETSPEECTGTGISGKIQAAAGLGNIGDKAGSIERLWQSDGTSMFIVYFCLLIFGIVMLVVLLAACIMLLIRAVTLMFLLVLSPLGFAATAIPQFEEYSKMWWNKLISQAFFAPAFLLMLFVGLKIMEGANRTFNPGNGASLTDAFADGGTSAGGIFISFALTIGFMIGALMVASQMGAMGASFATRQASGVVFGGMAKVGRHTVGKGMHEWAEKRAKDPKYRNGIGKYIRTTVAAGGKASYDARGMGIVGGAAKAAHLDLGKTKTGGYTKILHDEEEAHKKYADGLENSATEQAEIDSIEHKETGKIVVEQKAYAAMAKAMAEEHAKVMAPHVEKLRVATAEAEAARKTGDKTTILGAELAVQRANTAYSRQEGLNKEQRETAKKQHEEVIAALKARVKDIKEDPKKEYAANIGNPNPLLRATVYGQGAIHGSHKILKDLKKDDIQRLTDAVKGAKAVAEKPKASTDDSEH